MNTANLTHLCRLSKFDQNLIKMYMEKHNIVNCDLDLVLCGYILANKNIKNVKMCQLTKG